MKMTSTMVKKFIQILGEQRVYYDSFSLKAYEYDASQIVGNPEVVLFPKNVLEIQQILSFCNRTEKSVVVRGNGTSVFGEVTSKNHIIIDMSNFSKINKLNLTEKYVEVEPFVTVEDLNGILNARGFYFPFEPIDGKLKTIGGLVSNNYPTKYENYFGELEDYILSFEFIDGQGRHYSYKNNLDKSIIFSQGLTGVVIGLRLKIVPKIKKKKIYYEKFYNLKDLVDRYVEIKEIVDTKKNESGFDINLGKESGKLINSSFDKIKLGNCFFVSKSVSKRSGFEEVYHLFSDIFYFREEGEEESVVFDEFYLDKNVFEEEKVSILKKKKQEFSKTEFFKKIEESQKAKKFFYTDLLKISIQRYYDVIKYCEKLSIPVVGDFLSGEFLMKYKEEDWLISNSNNGILKNRDNKIYSFYSYLIQREEKCARSSQIGLIKKEYLEASEKKKIMAQKVKYDNNNIMNKNKVFGHEEYLNFKKTINEENREFFVGQKKHSFS